MSIVALEAGICGIPVLLTDQCGFGEIQFVDSRLEVTATVDGIAEGLLRLLLEPHALIDAAPIWRDFVMRHYAWESIAPRYVTLYRSVLGLLQTADLGGQA